MPLARLASTVANAASGSIVGAVSASDTTATITNGALLGIETPLRLAVWDRAYGSAAVARAAGRYELVTVTSLAGDSILDMVRGVDGTPAIDWDSLSTWQWDSVVSRSNWEELDQLLDAALDASWKWLDVEESPYGADRTGVADSTAPILAAIAAASPGDTVYVPEGTFRTTGTLTIPTGIHFQMDGRIQADFSGEAILVSGIDATLDVRPRMRFQLTRTAAHSASANVAVHADSVSGIDLDVDSAVGFSTALLVTSSAGVSTRGNRFSLGTLRDCRVGVEISRSGGGEVTQNAFLGGIYHLSSGSPAGYVSNRVGYRGIYSSSDGTSGNTFERFSTFDPGDTTFFATAIDWQSSNTSFERLTLVGAVSMVLQAASARNRIHVTLGGGIASVTDNGSDNAFSFEGTHQRYRTGTDPFRLESRAAGVAALRLENTAGGDAIDVVSPALFEDDANVAGRFRVGGGSPWADVTHPAFGAVADGVANDGPALQAGLDALQAAGGGTLFLPPTSAYYLITSEILIDSDNITIFGLGNPEIRQVTSGQAGIHIQGQRSKILLKDFHLRGPQFAAYNAQEMGIVADGTNSLAPSSRIKIENVHVESWGRSGIELRHVQRAVVERSEVADVIYFGVAFLSVSGGRIDGNWIHNVIGDNPGLGNDNSYGISLSRFDVASLANDALPERIVVKGNLVESVLLWEGIETHAGAGITIFGNTVQGCRRGISAGSGDDASGDPTYAPQRVSITGNTVYWDGSIGTAFEGIILHGAYDSSSGLVNEYATGVISGNYIRGHSQSTEATENSGAIRCYATHGLVISGNGIVDPAQSGIHITIYNAGFVCVGNSIIDPWRTSTSTVRIVGVYVQASQNQGIIDGNRVQYIGTSGVAGAEHLNDPTSTYGVFVVSGSGNQVQVGVNSAPDAGTAELLIGSLPSGTVGAPTDWTVGSKLSVAGISTFLSPLVLPGYPTASRPAATNQHLIFDTNLGVPLYASGGSWKRFSDDSVA